MKTIVKDNFELAVIEFIKNLRKNRQLTAKEFAEILNVSTSVLYKFENPNERASYDLKHIHMLAAHFNLSPKVFLPDHPIL